MIQTRISGLDFNNGTLHDVYWYWQHKTLITCNPRDKCHNKWFYSHTDFVVILCLYFLFNYCFFALEYLICQNSTRDLLVCDFGFDEN